MTSTDNSSISDIQRKIADRREVTESDLKACASLHNNREDFLRQIPLLDRDFLHGWDNVVSHEGLATSNRKIVRHVGMVQDMLEPEYYVQEYGGESMHFRDPLDLTADENKGSAANQGGRECNMPWKTLSNQLAERVPLVVVPLPFASSWYQTQVNPATSEELNAELGSSKRTVVIPESPPADGKATSEQASSRKRQRDLDKDTNGKPADGAKRNQTAPTKGDGQTMECDDATATPDKACLYGQESDWWPQGQFESSPTECPVLAKLYYDQYLNGAPKLRLNEVVEMIGVLSMDPWEASFESAQDDPFMDFQEPLPPPSRLPRLHVLSFRRLDVDQALFRAANAQEEESQAPEGQSTDAESKLEEWTQFCGDATDPRLSRILGLTLLGKAERTPSTADGEGGRMMRAPSHALGCASLELICDSAQASQRVYEQLLPFLRATCPIVAGIDGTLATGPSKMTGRLLPAPWQLPRGATVLLHVGDRPIATNVKEVLQELVEHHRMAYSFEGGMRVPFEADYRVVVVSASAKATRVLPAALTYTVSNTDDLGLPTNPATLNLLQKWIMHRRKSTNNIGLPQAVLEQAQKDFLQRRKMAREASRFQPNTSGGDDNDGMPEEGDFHRWLTLTRLLARASQRSAASIGDWEQALMIDDSLSL